MSHGLKQAFLISHPLQLVLSRTVDHFDANVSSRRGPVWSHTVSKPAPPPHPHLSHISLIIVNFLIGRVA